MTESDRATLVDLFRRVLMCFWMSPDSDLNHKDLPRVTTGTIEHAILCALWPTMRIDRETPTQQVYAILRAFPEAAELWTTEQIFAAHDVHDPHHVKIDWAPAYVTVRQVNEFLITDAVKNRLQQEFPEPYAAMVLEEERRGNESP